MPYGKSQRSGSGNVCGGGRKGSVGRVEERKKEGEEKKKKVNEDDDPRRIGKRGGKKEGPRKKNVIGGSWGRREEGNCFDEGTVKTPL